MVRLIPGTARRWNGNGPDDLSVARRVFVEIDDGEKVRRQPRLVAGPDVQRLWWSPSSSSSCRSFCAIVIGASAVMARTSVPTIPALQAVCRLRPYRSFRLEGHYRTDVLIRRQRLRNQFPAGSLMVESSFPPSGRLSERSPDAWKRWEPLHDPSRIYRFGAFAVDVRTGELTNAGRRTPLREQPFQLLLALLEQPGELITREELTSRLWPAGTFVDSDHGLNKAMNHLREALSDSADHPQFIETLPRKGYRFIAPVTQDSQESEPAAPGGPRGRSRHPREAAGYRRRSWLSLESRLAPRSASLTAGLRAGGLPCRALRPLPSYRLKICRTTPSRIILRDGMTDALITDLAKIGSLRITSRTSAMRYKGTKRSIQDIGRELNVDAVVEGTVTRSGSRARITAQLIQVSTDMHLWAETYERDVSEILTLQNTVATDIARRIDVVLRPLDLPRVVAGADAIPARKRGKAAAGEALDCDDRASAASGHAMRSGAIGPPRATRWIGTAGRATRRDEPNERSE